MNHDEQQPDGELEPIEMMARMLGFPQINAEGLALYQHYRISEWGDGSGWITGQ